MRRYSQGVVVTSGRHYVNAKIIDNAAIPLAWTDKDVSGYVGKARVLLLIRILEKGGIGEILVARTKGNTNSRGVDGYGSVSDWRAPTSTFADAIVETGPEGVFEWKSKHNVAVDAWLISYFD